jgi:hypothetical protein
MIVSGLRDQAKVSAPADYAAGPTLKDLAKSAPASGGVFSGSTSAVRGKTPDNGTRAETGVPIAVYALRSNPAELLRYAHQADSPGRPGAWAASSRVSEAVSDYLKLSPASGGFYAETLGGELHYLRVPDLQVTTVTSVSPGTYTQFAASSDGTLYAFAVDGSVDVIRMAFTENDEPKWSEVERTTGQWPTFLRVFTAGDGVFYTIATDGMLLHSRNELNAWTAQSVVGNGWAGFRDAFSPAPGVIYAIQPNGDLLWYRFRGHASGELAQGWEGPMKVGNGWQNFASVIGLPEIQ